MANKFPTEVPLAARWPRGQRLRPRIGRKYIRVLTRLTSVGTAACTFDIDTRPENWPTANLRHVCAACAQYGVGPTFVGTLLPRPEFHGLGIVALWFFCAGLGPCCVPDHTLL